MTRDVRTSDGRSTLRRSRVGATQRHTPASPISVLVISEIRLYREALAEMLGREGISVVGTAELPGAGLAMMRKRSPTLVLVDVAVGDGVAGVRAIVRDRPGTQVLALGVSELEDEVIAYAEAGAAGFIARGATLQEAVEAMKGAARGESICSPRTAAILLRRVGTLATQQVEHDSESRLTDRERQVLRLIEQSLSNKEIAQLLCLEIATVKNHVHSILQKLNLHRRGHAAAWLRGHEGTVIDERVHLD